MHAHSGRGPATELTVVQSLTTKPLGRGGARRNFRSRPSKGLQAREKRGCNGQIHNDHQRGDPPPVSCSSGGRGGEGIARPGYRKELRPSLRGQVASGPRGAAREPGSPVEDSWRRRAWARVPDQGRHRDGRALRSRLRPCEALSGGPPPRRARGHSQDFHDNSEEADPEAGKEPAPRLVLHLEAGRILGPEDLSQTPDWAKPIVAAALQRSLG
jgi:hypothetical protein